MRGHHVAYLYHRVWALYRCYFCQFIGTRNRIILAINSPASLTDRPGAAARGTSWRRLMNDAISVAAEPHGTIGTHDLCRSRSRRATFCVLFKQLVRSVLVLAVSRSPLFQFEYALVVEVTIETGRWWKLCHDLLSFASFISSLYSIMTKHHTNYTFFRSKDIGHFFFSTNNLLNPRT